MRSLEKNGKLTQNDCDFMVSGLVSFLKESGVVTFELTHYPFFYDSKTSKFVDHSYQSLGFKLIAENVNQHLKIDGVEFKAKLTEAKKNRLSKWYRSGFMACQESVDSLAEAYKFILASRERKDYDLSMTFSEMHSMFISHPDHYFLFTVRHQEKLIAVAISIKVSDDILYTYAYADHKDYLALSPTLLAVEKVYKFGQINEFNFIDLGTSSQNGVLNKGVYQFKKELGALESVKKKYVWNLKN